MLHEHCSLDFEIGASGPDGSGPFLPSSSPAGIGHVVFEDDLETGYFYAVLPRPHGEEVVDALHVYNVAQVTDRHLPSRASIAWNDRGSLAILLINDYPHAVFDFTGQRGWCRTGFPAPSIGGLWRQTSHAWDADVEAMLAREG